MIDIASEQLISLAEAAGMLPCGRKGRYPNVKTVYAWTTNGCRGILLATVQLAGRRATSKEAVHRFIQALTAAASTPRPATGRRADNTREAALEAELDRLGVSTESREVSRG